MISGWYKASDWPPVNYDMKALEITPCINTCEWTRISRSVFGLKKNDCVPIALSRDDRQIYATMEELIQISGNI